MGQVGFLLAESAAELGQLHRGSQPRQYSEYIANILIIYIYFDHLYFSGGFTLGFCRYFTRSKKILKFS